MKRLNREWNRENKEPQHPERSASGEPSPVAATVASRRGTGRPLRDQPAPCFPQKFLNEKGSKATATDDQAGSASEETDWRQGSKAKRDDRGTAVLLLQS